MARRQKGIIGLEVAGLSKVLSAGKQMAATFTKLNFVIGGVRQSIQLITGTFDRAMEVLRTAASDEAIANSFEALVGSAELAEEALNRLREATRGQVSDTELQLNVNKLLQAELNLSADEMGRLFDQVIRVGNISGKTAKESLTALSNALVKASDRTLKAMGVSIDYQIALEKEARALGVSVEALDLDTKRKILLAEVQKSLTDSTARLGDAQAPMAEAYNNLTRIFENLESEVVKILTTNPAFVKSLENIAVTLAKLAIAGSELLVVFEPLVELITANPIVFGALAGAATGFVVSGFNPIGAGVGAVIGAGFGGVAQFQEVPESLQPNIDTRGLANGIEKISRAGSVQAQVNVDRLAADLDSRAFAMTSFEGL